MKPATRTKTDLRMKSPAHPGGFVKHEIIEPLRLSVTDAAKVLGVTRPALSAASAKSVGPSGIPAGTISRSATWASITKGTSPRRRTPSSRTSASGAIGRVAGLSLRPLQSARLTAGSVALDLPLGAALLVASRR